MWIVQRQLLAHAEDWPKMRRIWFDFMDWRTKKLALMSMRNLKGIDHHKHRIVKRTTTIHDTIED